MSTQLLRQATGSILATDILVNPGKTRKATKEKVADFFRWFAITGFYASANIALKGSFHCQG